MTPEHLLLPSWRRRPRWRTNVLIGVGIVASAIAVPLLVHGPKDASRTVTWSPATYSLRATTRDAIDRACAAKAKVALPSPMTVDVRGGAGVAVYQPADGRLVCAFLIDAPSGPSAVTTLRPTDVVVVSGGPAPLTTHTTTVTLDHVTLDVVFGRCDQCGPRIGVPVGAQQAVVAVAYGQFGFWVPHGTDLTPAGWDLHAT